jgi:hypothetical protein
LFPLPVFDHCRLRFRATEACAERNAAATGDDRDILNSGAHPDDERRLSLIIERLGDIHLIATGVKITMKSDELTMFESSAQGNDRSRKSPEQYHL